MVSVLWSLLVIVCLGIAWDAHRNRVPIKTSEYEFNTGALAWALSPPCLTLLCGILIGPVAAPPLGMLATAAYYSRRRKRTLALGSGGSGSPAAIGIAGRYWLSRGETVEGPFSVPDLLEMSQGSTIKLDNLVCPEGSESWVALGSIFDRSPPPPASVAVAPVPHAGITTREPSYDLLTFIVVLIAFLAGFAYLTRDTWMYPNSARAQATSQVWRSLGEINHRNHSNSEHTGVTYLSAVATEYSQIDLTNVDPALQAFIRDSVATYQQAALRLQPFEDRAAELIGTQQSLAELGAAFGSTARDRYNPNGQAQAGAAFFGLLGAYATSDELSEIQAAYDAEVAQIEPDIDRLWTRKNRLARELSGRYKIEFLFTN